MEKLIIFIDLLLHKVLGKSELLEEMALKEVSDWISQFETEMPEGENIPKIKKGSTSSSAIIASVKKRLNEVLQNQDYTSMVDDILTGFDEIFDNVGQIHEKLNGIKISENFIKTTLSPAKSLVLKSTRELLSQTSINANVINPLTKILFESVEFGYSLSQAQRVLQDRININSYIGQISRDAFFQYDGTLNKLIGERYGLEGIRYVGGLVSDSRGQCRKWTKIKVIKKEDLKKEIAWAKRAKSYEGHDVSGFIHSTTVDNFHVYRGGYNCRHRAFPVRLEE